MEETECLGTIITANRKAAREINNEVQNKTHLLPKKNKK